MTKLFLSLILCAGALLADVTGKWSGSFDLTGPDGESKSATAYMSLTQSDKSITGTVGPNGGEQHPIKVGAIDDNRITLEVDHDGILIKFDLTLDGDHIRGTANGEHDGHKMAAKLDLKRLD